MRGSVGWKWKVGAYRVKIGCSTCKSSPQAAFDECLTRFTTKSAGMWSFFRAHAVVARRGLAASASPASRLATPGQSRRPSTLLWQQSLTLVSMLQQVAARDKRCCDSRSLALPKQAFTHDQQRWGWHGATRAPGEEQPR